MPEISKLLSDYKITSDDIHNIKLAAPFLIGKKEEVADHHYSILLGKEETAVFFKDDKVLDRARRAFIGWFEDMLEADYTPSYYVRLNRIGGTHVRIGLPAHHVNVQMSHMRALLADYTRRHYSDDEETATRTINSLNKVIDMNLDLMTRSYREEELSANFLSHRVDSGIIRFARWITSGFNMALVAGLVSIGLMALGLVSIDIVKLFEGGMERGVLSALGSLLILWVVIELLDTQIGHMKGHAFAVKVFVAVAFVAELRKVLISSIEHTEWLQNATLAMSVFLLGVVYWLISQVEKK